MKFKIDQIDQVVKKEIIPKFKTHKIFTFTGPLGAGKTTIIKNILKQMGVSEIVTSPTFTYLNIYTTEDDKKFYHFDLYRLKTQQSFLDSGFEEYFDFDVNSGNKWVLIEWPKVIEDFLQTLPSKDEVCNISLNYFADNQNSREIKICI